MTSNEIISDPYLIPAPLLLGLNLIFGIMYLRSLFIFSAIVSQCVYSLPVNEPDGIVQTNNGKLRGKLLYTPKKVPFWAFLEVPYATPPVGELRLKRPRPPLNWQGILNATENTKICWETRKNKQKIDPRENEDCLYLNVYVPKEPKSPGPLPVMVYFTGGAYNFNDGTFKSYKPYVFVELDVISVFTNFRQGAFGFLSTGDNVIPGNNALWDQRMSLIWVKNNIARFGGDPEKVTIMGHSSGAACVGAHVASKQSSGLFRSAIMESMSLLGPIARHPRYYAFKLGQALSTNFSMRNSSEDLLRLLNSVHPSALTNLSYQIDLPYMYADRRFRLDFRIVIENADEDHTFLKAPLYDNMLNGKLNKVPLLVGVTSEEHINLAKNKTTAKICDEDQTCIVSPNSILKVEDRSSFVAELRQLYTKVPFAENITALTKLTGDRDVTFPVISQADLHSQYADVFFYKFSYFGPLNLDKPKRLEGAGLAGHCAELPYLVYYHLDGDDKEYPATDLLTRDRLGRLFTNFIKYSNPTPEDDPVLQNVRWPKFHSDDQLFLDIDSNLTVRSKPNSLYFDWLAIIKKYYKAPINIILN